MSQVSTSNGPATEVEDDTFERDLKEMLKDGPSLNDLSSTVQGGNPVGPGAPPASGMRGGQPPGTGANMQTRPTTMHPQGGPFAGKFLYCFYFYNGFLCRNLHLCLDCWN